MKGKNFRLGLISLPIDNGQRITYGKHFRLQSKSLACMIKEYLSGVPEGTEIRSTGFCEQSREVKREFYTPALR